MNDITRRLWIAALKIHLEQQFGSSGLASNQAAMIEYLGGLTDTEKVTLLRPIYTQMRTEKEQQRDRLSVDFAAAQAKEQQRLDDEIIELQELEVVQVGER